VQRERLVEQCVERDLVAVGEDVAGQQGDQAGHARQAVGWRPEYGSSSSRRA
jgi:hypothetical protein